MAREIADIVATATSPKPTRSSNNNFTTSTTTMTTSAATINGGNNNIHNTANTQPSQRRGNKGIEPIFHPQLRRTKEVIRRPEWVRRAGEAVAHRGSLNSMALFGILFANCVGGGYGFEDGIGSAGPLITTIVCVLLPWIWAFPTGLAVAELSTAVPSNSGVLMWTNAAFPPFMSFLCIMATIFITFIGNATYPNLTAEYVENIIPLNKGGIAGVKIGVIVICCVLNCVGVEIVGKSSVILCAITITPFMLLTLIQLFGHGFNKAVLYVDVKQVNWADFFSIISWNYANIENAGAVVEEIANPRRALPSAMMLLMISTYVAYVLPMLAGVSAMGVGQDYSQWQAGHWPDVAQVIAGAWLKYLLFCGAILSGLGFTLTSMCCTSRLLAGMGTMHMFPKKISRLVGYYHPKLGTPIPAIVCNSIVTMVFSVSLDFTSVVALCQSLYCIRMLLIYAALVKLRIQFPRLARPYSLPCNTWVAALSLVPAALFSLFAAVISAMTSLAIGIAFVCFIVLGSALSWVYCRIFARNGFQGVIVQCEMSATDDDEVSATSEPEEVLNEGVFYHDDEDDDINNDGTNNTGGDLLLGILPLNADVNTNSDENLHNVNSSAVFSVNRSVAFNAQNTYNYNDNNNDDDDVDKYKNNNINNNNDSHENTIYVRPRHADEYNSYNNNLHDFTISNEHVPVPWREHVTDVEMTNAMDLCDGVVNDAYSNDNNNLRSNFSNMRHDNSNNIGSVPNTCIPSNDTKYYGNIERRKEYVLETTANRAPNEMRNIFADSNHVSPVKKMKYLGDITNKIKSRRLEEKNAHESNIYNTDYIANNTSKNIDNDNNEAWSTESDSDIANYSPRSVNTPNINDINECSDHQSTPHWQRAHYRDANANVINNSIESTPPSTLSEHANQIVEEAHSHDGKDEKLSKNNNDNK